MASNGFFSPQRNAHRNMNANTGGTTLKRRSDNRGCGNIGGFQEDRSRYAPPQKRARSQTQTQFRSANSGRNPLYHDGSNVSRVSQSYNYNGDMMIGSSNSSNSFPLALRNNDSSPSMIMTTNIDYQKPFGYGIANPQSVPVPLPYRKLDDFDSLPEWVPNQSVSTTLNHSIPNFAAPNVASQASGFMNFQNQNPMSVNHSNMFSIVSQVMPQPIVSKELTDLLSILNNENDKQNSNKEESPLGMSFDDVSLLKVRHESVIKSLYSDMPRQCSSCGVRFKCQEEHRNHMDWHVRKNRMAKDANKTSSRASQKPKKSRGWLASASLWLIDATGGAKETCKASFNSNGEKLKKEEEEKQHVVPADEDQKMCALCQEPFEEFFSHEADDWLYKDAVYLNKNEQTNTHGPIVHAKCMPEPRKGTAKDLRKPIGMSVAVPAVASALVC